MILVDTSVWIEYFNGKESEHADALDEALVAGTVVIGDLILLEILQGFRNDSDYQKAKTMLANIEQFEMLGRRMVAKCATNYRTLRKKGFTVRRTTDVIIATFCIENKIPLLCQDRDFVPFVEKLGLVPVLRET